MLFHHSKIKKELPEPFRIKVPDTYESGIGFKAIFKLFNLNHFVVPNSPQEKMLQEIYMVI